MRDVVKALRVFVMWLQNGMYEYSYFPITVKEDMKESSAWDNYVNEARIKGMITNLPVEHLGRYFNGLARPQK